MPADYYAPGAVDLFYKSRPKSQTGPIPPPVLTADDVEVDDDGDLNIISWDEVVRRNKYQVPTQSVTTPGWKYIGSATTAPEVEAVVTHTPFNADITSGTPFQLIFNTEQHRVTATLNRLNWKNWTYLRNHFEGDGTNARRAFTSGGLILQSKDVELYLRYVNPHTQGFVGPDGHNTGRLYHSAVLTDFHETTVNGRVLEVTVVIDCYPVRWRSLGKQFQLYYEAPQSVTPE